MNSIVDTVVSILFVLFMIFIFGGYHKNKSSQREEQFKKDRDLNEKNS